VIAVGRGVLPTVISISFDLDDKLFTMVVKSTKKVDELILRLMEQKTVEDKSFRFYGETSVKRVPYKGNLFRRGIV